MVSIDVVIPTIPPRDQLLLKALMLDIHHQTRQPDGVIIQTDYHGEGAAATRNAAIAKSTSDFIALFDDDDRMYPRHLELLERTQIETGADLVYPWHDIVPSRKNPLTVRGANPYGRPFDPAARRQIREGINFIPIAVLVRREAMVEIGGFRDFELEEWDPARCEVLDAWQRLLNAGAKFAHCPKRTWAAIRNGENTAGLSWPTHIGTKQRGYDKGAGK